MNEILLDKRLTQKHNTEKLFLKSFGTESDSSTSQKMYYEYYDSNPGKNSSGSEFEQLSDPKDIDSELQNVPSLKFGIIATNLGKVGDIVHKNSKNKETIRSNFLEGTSRMPDLNFELVKIYSKWFETQILPKSDKASQNKNEQIFFLIEELKNFDSRRRIGSLAKIYNILLLEHPFQTEDVLFITKSISKFLTHKNFENCDLSMYILLEIIFFVGSDKISCQILNELSQILFSKKPNTIKEVVLRIFFSLDYVGISNLFEFFRAGLGPAGDKNRACELVGLLVAQPLVIETILVPALLTKFHSADHKTISSTVQIFMNFGEFGSKSEILDILLEMIKNSKFDKNSLVACMRSLGIAGEQELLNLAKKTKKNQLLSTICFHLGSNPKQYFEPPKIEILR